jgi:hypothetical protein
MPASKCIQNDASIYLFVARNLPQNPIQRSDP